VVENLDRLITEQQIADFERDGVICLRGLFGKSWVERLRNAVDGLLKDSSQAGEMYSLLGQHMARTNREFDCFVKQSPAAAIAKRMMRSQQVRFYFDHLLIKEPGTRGPSPWHHDLPYWPVQGNQICSIWLTLDPVTKESSGLQYIAGSHRWGKKFHPPESEDLGFSGDDKMPDIGNNLESYTLLDWDMEPGDCLVHHGLTVHGAGGNMTLDVRRRALATRWLGDDATYREGGGDPALRVENLRTGDAMPDELFPFVAVK